MKKPTIKFKTDGELVEELVSIEITNPELNPRFVLGLIRNVEIKPSPYQIQRRLELAGMRPINNIVDATNYAMLDLGEPLHAFDYDVLERTRRYKKPIKIITRPAKDGEKLTTLDNVERTLTSMNVLVCDEKGPLSMAGVMGGAESRSHAKRRAIFCWKARRGISLTFDAPPNNIIFHPKPRSDSRAAFILRWQRPASNADCN